MVAILVKELKEMMRDGRIKIVAIISLILLVISSITGINKYQKKNKELIGSVELIAFQKKWINKKQIKKSQCLI